jgi:flagellar biosynthesis/type III secretory pathway chaperone
MPTLDPTNCREQLASLMAEQNMHLAALELLLTQEFDLLQARDADGLEKAVTARQQCIGHVSRIEDQRRALCRSAGCSDDASGLHALLAWCDPTASLRAVMSEYRERTARCREQNDRNGFLVNGRLQQESDGYGAGADPGGDRGRKLVTRA